MALNKIYTNDVKNQNAPILVGETDRNPATVFVEAIGDPFNPVGYRLIDGMGEPILTAEQEKQALEDEKRKTESRLAELNKIVPDTPTKDVDGSEVTTLPADKKVDKAL